jgi:hypothetical protein
MRTVPITGLAAGTYTITATLSQSPDCAVTRTLLLRVRACLTSPKHIPKSLASQVIMMDQFQ